MIYWLLALVAVLISAGVIYQWFGTRRDARELPPPGRIINGFHVQIEGDSGPVVVLEAGMASSSLAWRLVSNQLRRDFRVISYDRFGFGWSAAPKSPRSIPTLCDELHQMLQFAGLAGPFLFAGHSFGGLMLRHYAKMYPREVAGLVLVDPLEPMEWCPLTPERKRMVWYGAMLSRRGATLARMGVVRLTLDLLMTGATAIPKMVGTAMSGPGGAVMNRLVGEVKKLPVELWPAVKANWCKPLGFATMAEYLKRIPENCAQPVDSSALREIPTVVISSSTTPQQTVEAHRETAGASRFGEYIVAGKSGHWVLFDEPELVADAVRRVARYTGEDVR